MVPLVTKCDFLNIPKNATRQIAQKGCIHATGEVQLQANDSKNIKTDREFLLWGVPLGSFNACQEQGEVPVLRKWVGEAKLLMHEPYYI